jgi:hypothetical protein
MNLLTVNGTAEAVEITGRGAQIYGLGTIESVAKNTPECIIHVKNTGTVSDHKSCGLYGVDIALTTPDDLPAGDALGASVSITALSADGRVCQGKWYLNDVLVSETNVALAPDASLQFSYPFQYSRDFPDSAKLSFVLSDTTDSGEYQEIRADRYIKLENYSNDYYDQLDRNRILSLVTTGYQGDFTLAWAEANDYQNADKEKWMNAEGHSSNTAYLIWVSIAYQRANIFTGSAGNWKLDRTFIVGTGAPGKDTPTGRWTIIGKLSGGWSTSTYTVKPVVNFIDSSYGFHSRLYYPGTTEIEDASIGFPVSHGCVRMYTDDVAWFYDNIPIGSTVIVY